ncbi:MAG: T9SS type A sorting domain-containing protein [Bacteroidota bacterium]
MQIRINHWFIAFLIISATGLAASLQISAQTVPDTDYSAYPAWIGMMEDPKGNFFETQKAFYTYWENRTTHRGDGYKPFKRWENYWLFRINPDGTFPEPGYVSREYARYIREHPKSESLKSSDMPWTELGPKTRVNYGGYTGLGRLNAIACNPADTSIVYVCAPSGGVWKTTNGGADWQPLTEELPSLGASAILIHPTRTNEILVGTGDRDHGDARGIGVIRSTDDGQSWEQYNTGMGNVTVGMFARSETNPDLILAATSGGIFKTINGGATWTKQTEVTGHYKDVKFKPGNHNIAYSIIANTTAFFRSEDAGETWLQVPDSNGLPKTGRLVIGVTPAAPNLVYLISGADSFVGCYVSQDDGKTFITQSTTPNILGYAQDGSDVGSQAWYDLCFHVDPLNAQVLHVGGVNLWRSDNGGKAWRITGHWTGSGAQEIHADQHTFYYNPANKRLYAGNDGGIYYTDNQGTSWKEITEGLGIGQIYRLGVSLTNSQKIVTGFQDNGSATWIGTEWWTSGGGDGMECAFDPADYQYSYITLYYGYIDQLLFNGYQRRVAGEGSNGITEKGAWITPFIIHEEDGNTMIAGYKNIWITHDLKNTNISWKKITSNLAGRDDVLMTALEQSPADLKVLYASRQDRKFFRTDDFTLPVPVWLDLSSNLPTENIASDIEAHPYDPLTVYITLGRKVYKSADKGETWTDISGSLPSIAMNSIAFDKSGNEGLYVGTDAGVYYRDADMTDWVFFNAGLPAAAEITDLEIYYDHLDRNKSRLRAATFGRGLWETGLAASMPILPVTALQAVPASSAICLYWNAPFYPQYLTNYRIYRNNQYYGMSTSPFYSDDLVEKNTDYTYYVVAEYFGNTYSDPSNRASAILIDPVILPYSVDFNQSTAGWAGNKAANGWLYGTSMDLGIPRNDDHFYGIESLSGSAGTHITGCLASPVMDLTSHTGSELSLRFASAFLQNNDTSKFCIAYRTSPEKAWTILEQFPPSGQADWVWTTTTVILPPEAISAKTQIGFIYDNGYEKAGGAAVDNIELFVSIAGIPDLVKPSGLKIYPNPSNGSFSIDLDQAMPGDIRIRIMNLNGQIVTERLIRSFLGSMSESFSLYEEPKGLYLINIHTDSGEWNEKITLR